MKLNSEQRAMVEANMGLVPYAVKKYLGHLYIEYDDKVSIGYYWLCRAAYAYRPDSGIAFSTFAIKVIVRGIMKKAIYDVREKRGGGRVTVSLDKKLLEAQEAIPDPADIENETIDRIICEPVWKYVPTYIKIQRKGVSQKQYARELGVSPQAVSNWLKKEYRTARWYLRLNGVNGPYTTV